MKRIEITRAMIDSRLRELGHFGPESIVYGVPKNGTIIAEIIRGLFACSVTDDPDEATVIVDDVIDSGTTRERFRQHRAPFVALFENQWTSETWYSFPWERDETPAADGVTRLLTLIGEDPKRPGLVDTPRRVVRALMEMTAGMRQDPAAILGTTFEDDADEMIVVRGIWFSSLCEHHLLPFSGTVAIGYIPNGRVVGLSKIPRLVRVFAKRLQMQERMTRQIADAMMDVLSPAGVGVIAKAHHSCMGCRGVEQAAAEMVTSCLRGAMRDNDAARAELLRFC